MENYKFKINLHVLEGCNFRCKHCFAKFGPDDFKLKADHWLNIINNCEYSNCIDSYNIAGGEPLLYFHHLKSILEKSKKKFSIITNGSLINDKFYSDLLKYFYMVGISIDSFNHKTNIDIGRCKGEYTLSFEDVKEIIEKIKSIKPDCIIKINTVVLKQNKDENIWEKLKELPIDKWKILKSKKFEYDNKNNFEYIVTNEEYEDFVYKNIGIKINDFSISKIVKHGNKEIIIEPSLEESYLFIDSNGFLIDNKTNKNVSILDLKKEHLTQEFIKKFLNIEKYKSRYK